jgi:hypothetical protein
MQPLDLRPIALDKNVILERIFSPLQTRRGKDKEIHIERERKKCGLLLMQRGSLMHL